MSIIDKFYQFINKQEEEEEDDVALDLTEDTEMTDAENKLLSDYISWRINDMEEKDIEYDEEFNPTEDYDEEEGEAESADDDILKLLKQDPYEVSPVDPAIQEEVSQEGGKMPYPKVGDPMRKFAVYSSTEPAPQGVMPYKTKQNVTWWIRTPQNPGNISNKDAVQLGLYSSIEQANMARRTQEHKTFEGKSGKPQKGIPFEKPYKTPEKIKRLTNPNKDEQRIARIAGTFETNKEGQEYLDKLKIQRKESGVDPIYHKHKTAPNSPLRGKDGKPKHILFLSLNSESDLEGLVLRNANRKSPEDWRELLASHGATDVRLPMKKNCNVQLMYTDKNGKRQVILSDKEHFKQAIQKWQKNEIYDEHYLNIQKALRNQFNKGEIPLTEAQKCGMLLLATGMRHGTKEKLTKEEREGYGASEIPGEGMLHLTTNNVQVLENGDVQINLVGKSDTAQKFVLKANTPEAKMVAKQLQATKIAAKGKPEDRTEADGGGHYLFYGQATDKGASGQLTQVTADRQTKLNRDSASKKNGEALRLWMKQSMGEKKYDDAVKRLGAPNYMIGRRTKATAVAKEIFDRGVQENKDAKKRGEELPHTEADLIRLASHGVGDHLQHYRGMGSSNRPGSKISGARKFLWRYEHDNAHTGATQGTNITTGATALQYYIGPTAFKMSREERLAVFEAAGTMSEEEWEDVVGPKFLHMIRKDPASMYKEVKDKILSEDVDADAEEYFEKAWMTNPRGADDSYKKKLKKEGDGGGFGDGGGTVFTSSDSGIFTPTHSERGKRKKNESKKKTGIERLEQFVSGNSPERKMVKATPSFTLELVNWVKEELRKGEFRQQNSGESINDQPPRIDWKKKDMDIPEDKDDVLEFDAETDKQADVTQNGETERIKQLDDEEENDKPKDTGRSDMASPAGVNVQLAMPFGSAERQRRKKQGVTVQLAMPYESGGYESDALRQGASKDLEQGDVDDPADEHDDEEFVKSFMKDLEILKNYYEGEDETES